MDDKKEINVFEVQGETGKQIKKKKRKCGKQITLV